MGKWRYGVVLDAGSSGTRLHVYRWLNGAVAKAIATEADLHKLPVVSTKKKWTLKVQPGISTFGETPNAVGPDHLADLFEHALDVVPEEEVPNTPLFLLATAGMRLLDEMPKQAILDAVCSYAHMTTRFLLPDCELHIQVISGETEGLYGWIAANYLVGGFDRPQEHQHGDNHHTFGFLDMGGASAQIAFAPNSTESAKHANDLELLRLRTIDGAPSEYRVFVTTWLGYGVHEARRNYVKALLDSVDLEETKLLPDPCLPKDLEVKKDGTIIEDDSDEAQGIEPYLLGTGRFAECLAQTLPLLDKNAICKDPPCLFHGVHVPAIDFHTNHFIGISEYWHTTHGIFEADHTNKAYDFLTYQTRVTEFCSQQWDTITSTANVDGDGDKFDEERAAEVCFKAAWIINVLHEGIGIPRVGIETGKQPQGQNGTEAVIEAAKQEGYLAPFQALNKVDDTEVSWTLGKMVLFAASQVPPSSNKDLPVGFGSNVPGIPEDFQYAGGTPDTTIPSDVDIEDLLEDLREANEGGDGDWKSALLSTGNITRRTPGFILFVLIIVVALFLLCGRERRNSLTHKLTGAFRRRKPGDGRFSSMRHRQRDNGSRFPFGLGGSRKGKYNRVMDDGDVETPAPADFELSTVSSSSDDDAASLSSRSSATANGRSSGRSGTVTPRGGTVTPRTVTSVSPPRLSSSGYFGNASLSPSSQGVGLGLSMAAMGQQSSFDRGGLVPRTESRERLERMTRSMTNESGGVGSSSSGILGLGTGTVLGAGTGHRSRTGSPTRWRSPLLTPLKESLD